MSNSYPVPTNDPSDGRYSDGYSFATGLSIWTWDEDEGEFVVTPRPDVPNGYGG